MTTPAPESIHSVAFSRQNERFESASQWQKTIENSPALAVSPILSRSAPESQGQIPGSVAVATGEQKLGSAQPNTATRTFFRTKQAGLRALPISAPPPIGITPALRSAEMVCSKPGRPKSPVLLFAT